MKVRSLVLSVLAVGLLATGVRATPIDSVDLGDHEIQLLSANVFDGQFYVWTYQITSGRRPAISHVGLTVCEDLLSHANEDYEVIGRTRDAHGNVLIKFDEGYDDFETRTVELFLTGPATMGDGLVAVKAGRGFHTGTITSPLCNGGEVPEPGTLALVCAGILGLATRRKRFF